VWAAAAGRPAPQGKRIAALVRDGAVGELRFVRSYFRWNLPADSGDVRLVSALGGGALLDIGCYCLGSIRTIAGEPERVEAQQVLGGDGVDVRFAATLRMPGDVLAAFDCSFDAPWAVGVEVVGSEGVLRSRHPWIGIDPQVHVERDGTIEPIAVETPDVYGTQWDGFRAAIAGEPTVLDREETRQQATVLDALLRAAETGSAVELDATG
jgi:predicted dehydrogenase